MLYWIHSYSYYMNYKKNIAIDFILLLSVKTDVVLNSFLLHVYISDNSFYK